MGNFLNIPMDFIGNYFSDYREIFEKFIDDGKSRAKIIKDL